MRQHRFIYNRFIYNIVTLALVILLSVLAGSCGRKSQMLRTLEAAEQLMDERADSALAILDTIDPAHLRTDEEHALYGLLYTQALAKNRLPMPPDSLISNATNYFKVKGDNVRYVTASYFQGLKYYTNGDYTTAILCFVKTKESAEADSLFFWAGLGCRGMADIFEKTQNFADMKVYHRHALNYFNKDENKLYADHAVLDLARALCYTEEYTASNDLLYNFIKGKDSVNDAGLLHTAYGIIANNLNNQAKYQAATPWHIKAIQSSKATTEDSLRYAINLMVTGNKKNAQEIIEKVDNETGQIGHFVKVNMIADKGHYEEAFKEYHKYSLNLDTLNNPASRNSISSILNEYHNFRIQASSAEIRNAKVVHILIMIIILLVAGIFLYVLIRKNIYLRRMIDEGLIKLESLKTKLKRSQKKNEQKINAADSDKFLFAILDKVGQEIYTTNDKEKAIQRLKQSIDNKIGKYVLGNQIFKELETVLNKKYKGLIEDLKKDLPNLKEVDINLFILSAFNFTSQSIAGFLDVEDVNLIYGRKKRLKNRINELTGSSKDRYLAFLKN